MIITSNLLNQANTSTEVIHDDGMFLHLLPGCVSKSLQTYQDVVYGSKREETLATSRT